MSNDDRPSFVGLFDILGFREMVHDKTIPELREFLQELPSAAQPGVKALQFSDTILLYTTGTHARKLRPLIESACILVAAYASSGIGIRGGIAAGEFSHKEGIFVGKAMIRAYELEQSQDWAGAIVAPELVADLLKSNPEAIESLLRNQYLVPYEAPIKGGKVGQLHCIGWPVAAEDVDVTTFHIGRNWDVMRKWANTEKFRRHWNELRNNPIHKSV